MSSCKLNLSVDTPSALKILLSIAVPQDAVDAAYEEVFEAQRRSGSAVGFKQGEIPIDYVRRTFSKQATSHLKKFFLKQCVIDFLYSEIRARKLALAGEPLLGIVSIEPKKEATFRFDATPAEQLVLRHWKNTPYKSIGRKHYRDLDRQVEDLIQTELENAEKSDGKIDVDDWVCLEISPLNYKDKPIIGGHKGVLWVKIGCEAADEPFRKTLLGLKSGNRFKTDSSALRQFFGSDAIKAYAFDVLIAGVVDHSVLSIPHLKRHFKIKTNPEVHSKLIEVFSTKNDLPLRRAIVDETLSRLLKRYPVCPPEDSVIQQRDNLIKEMQDSPDYAVYKKRSSFEDMILRLSERMAREKILIDQISYRERIRVSRPDIEAYLNLTKRDRTRDFIHFRPPESRIDGQEMPVPNAVMALCCLREKTLNYAINCLTKK